MIIKSLGNATTDPILKKKNSIRYCRYQYRFYGIHSLRLLIKIQAIDKMRNKQKLELLTNLDYCYKNGDFDEKNRETRKPLVCGYNFRF